MTEEGALAGEATPEGTRRRAEGAGMGEDFYRDVDGLQLSTLGLGTYLGDVTDTAINAYREAVQRSLEGGITLVDTAINYRNQQSERDIAHALQATGDREAVFVSTKAGFLHDDVAHKRGPQAYMRNVYIDPGILEPQDIVGGVHAMTPVFLRHELGQSLENLGLEHVDLYLLHNPETQLNEGVSREAFHSRALEAFVELEEQRAESRLGAYGVATWDGLRLPPDNPGHLGLERLLELAEEAFEQTESPHDEHGFGGVQLPFNLHMTEALTRPTQPWDGDVVPVLEAVEDAGLVALGSASLLQGRLLGHIPDEVLEALDAETEVQAALEFARSAPGITTALVGMGSPEHVDENLAAMEGRKPRRDAVEEVAALVAE